MPQETQQFFYYFVKSPMGEINFRAPPYVESYKKMLVPGEILLKDHKENTKHQIFLPQIVVQNRSSTRTILRNNIIHYCPYLKK